MSENFKPASIEIGNGAGTGFTVDLSSFGKDKVTFGSGELADIVIDSTAVSENQGYFQFSNGCWSIVNNAKDGMLVNGSVQNFAELSNDTEVRFGDVADELNAVTMHVSIEAAEAPVEAAPKRKKKSKAPIIIVIVLVALFILGFIGFLIVGALGLLGAGAIGIFAFMNKNKEVTIEDTTSAYVETTEMPGGDIVPDETTTQEPTQAPVELPPRVPTSAYCEQFILAKCKGSYTTLTLYEMEDGVWVEKMTMDGRVGKNGITDYKCEGDGCTPAGEFDLTFCCGLTNPNSQMMFVEINNKSVWVDDSSSMYYNTLQNSDFVYADWNSAEPMMSSYFSNGRHNYCINIGANGDGYTMGSATPGRGSVITLCGKNDTLTETHGCMDISDSDMIDLLYYLDSDKNPVIIIYE